MTSPREIGQRARLQNWEQPQPIAEHARTFRGRLWVPLEMAEAELQFWQKRDWQHAEALASGEGWQDIETAPKDGTEILGWRADCGVLLIRWTSAAEFLTDAELEDWTEDAAYAENWFMADFVSGDRLERENEPTHWRPLPAPPVSDTGERG